jgi:predicted membrane protein
MADGGIRENVGRLVFGLAVIAMGVLFTLDKLGYVDAGQFWAYWPVVLIALGIGRVIQPRMGHGRGFGVVLIVVGIWFLLSNLDIIHYRFEDVWPILLVLLGIMIVWRAIAGSPWDGVRRRVREAMENGIEHGGAAVAGQTTTGTDTSDTIRAIALLGGVKRKCVSQDFRGGEVTAIIGGCELDLRHASISSGRAVIDTFAFWGGIQIKVPQEWSVELQGTPILGAFDDKTVRAGGDGSKVLVVRGVALMGGVDLKN